jgi:hypothetical protein
VKARVANRHDLEIVESFYDSGTLMCRAQPIAQPTAAFWFGLQLVGDGAETGQSEFAGLRKAVGVLDPSDSSEMHFKPFSADVDLIDGKYVASGFKPAGEPVEVVARHKDRSKRFLEIERPLFELRRQATLLECYQRDVLEDRMSAGGVTLDADEAEMLTGAILDLFNRVNDISRIAAGDAS